MLLLKVTGKGLFSEPKKRRVQLYEITTAENVEEGRDPDGSGCILRVTQDWRSVSNVSLIGDRYPMDLYYAYGIRNSFGMDFDPVTGNLWDSENGDRFGDEINFVKPGFKSGWNRVQGIWREASRSAGPIVSSTQESDMLTDLGQGKYSDPEFTWIQIVGPSAVKFESEKYGKEDENDMFVDGFHNGNVYHFDLSEDRTSLKLEGTLKDKVANRIDEAKATLLG